MRAARTLSPALLCLVLAFGPSACAEFPELDARPSRAPANAPYPTLLPLDGLVEAARAPGRGEAVTADVAGRAAALRARAGALRGAVVDDATRARMQAALATPSG
jgi:hypothetical protein